LGAEETNIEIVSGLYKAFKARDNEAPFEFYDDEIEWDLTRFGEIFGGDIDFEGVYRGHEGVRQYWREWLAAWETIEFEVDELVAIGDCVLAGPIHQRMRGRASGILIETPAWWQLWRLREGKVTRATPYPSRAEALSAAEPG